MNTATLPLGEPGEMETAIIEPFMMLHVEVETKALRSGPTLAVQTKPAMKLLPMTVTVLLTYAAEGTTYVAFGGARTNKVKLYEFNRAGELKISKNNKDAEPGKPEDATPKSRSTNAVVTLKI